MRNNIQNDVKTEKPLGKVSKFNLSGSLSNTHSIGEVSVAFSRLLQPHSKSMCGVENLLYLAPMVAPVYAKQHYKTWHQFCPIEDVWPNYSAFMTGQSISRNGYTFVPTQKPWIYKSDLSAYCLVGSHVSCYIADVTGKDLSTEPLTKSAVRRLAFFDINDSHLGASTSYWWKIADEILSDYFVIQENDSPSYFNFTKFAHTPSFNNIFSSMPISNIDAVFTESGTDYPTYSSFFRGSMAAGIESATGFVNEQISLDGADAILYRKVSHTAFDENDTDKVFIVALAVKFSSWGAHLFKTLRGLGYGFDLDDNTPVDILPILATYKCYWDIFGLEMWQNFESTYCGKLISTLQCHDCIYSILDFDNTEIQLWINFVYYELGSMWLTEQNDYISAHLPQPTISALNETAVRNVIDTTSSSGDLTPGAVIVVANNSSQQSSHPSMSYPDGHSHTTSDHHGHLDSEILKRLYKRVNTNTALGRKIADLMRSQGLGTYMERTKVHYIGDTNVDIDVTPVISQADTFAANGDGKVLGSRAGKGVGYGNTKKKLFYENDSLGWWICLDCVTCDSGYSQSEDLTLQAITNDKCYQSDYDALGMELHSKAVVNGSRSVSFGGMLYSVRDTANAQPYGFAPRFSSYKVGRNCLNGGFALRSVDKTFVPYVMDKLIYPDDAFVESLPDNYTEAGVTFPTGSKFSRISLDLPLQDIPVAGTAWRYLNRYSWLSNLNRAFANVDNPRPPITWSGSAYEDWQHFIEFLYRLDDNYISLSEIWFKSWSHMLPIEETYGTIDPDEKALEYVSRV